MWLGKSIFRQSRTNAENLNSCVVIISVNAFLLKSMSSMILFLRDVIPRNFKICTSSYYNSSALLKCRSCLYVLDFDWLLHQAFMAFYIRTWCNGRKSPSTRLFTTLKSSLTSPTKPETRKSTRIQNFDQVIPKDGIYKIIGLTFCLIIKSIFILDNMH